MDYGHYRRFQNLMCGPAWCNANVSGALRWTCAKTHRGSQRRNPRCIKKPDIRPQLWPTSRSCQTCCNRAGSIYGRPHMAHS